MFDTHVPVHFWPKAIATATYLTNRLPTKILQFQTPLATLNTFTPVPSSHSLPPRIFGCVVYVHLPSRARTKFESRAVKCMFLGMALHKRAIDVMILSITNFIPPWIVTSLNNPPTTTNLDLRGRV